MVRAGLKAIYLSRLAGRGRCQHGRRRCTRTRAFTRPTRCPTWCGGSTRRSSAPTRSSMPRAAGTRLVRADRGRRGGRLRRPAQRLRADEGDDRGRRRRRPLRGPARLGEEVRPHGRQGAGADAAQFIRTLIAARLAADVMDVPTLLVARTDADSAKLLTSRRRRARPRLHRPASAPPEGFFRMRKGRRGALPSPAAWPTRLTPTSSGARPRTPDLAEARRVRRGGPREVPGQAAGLQLLALVQLEGQARRRDHRASSSASSAPWATSSSSSRWPASTR